MFQIGIGNCFVNPVGGNLPTNPTPTFLPVIQDFSCDMTGTIKELMGQYKFPVDVAPVDMKCTGKFSLGSIELQMENNMIWADTFTTGVLALPPAAAGDSQAIGATVTATHHTAPFTDLGVTFNGIVMTKVPSAPGVGQYSVVLTTGVYSFNAADVTTSGNVDLYYGYTSTTGNTLSIHNQLIGYGPVVELYVAESYQPGVGGVVGGIYLPQVRITSVKTPLKRDDYTKIEYDFSFFARPSDGLVAAKYQTVL